MRTEEPSMIQLDDGWTGKIYHEWGFSQEIVENWNILKEPAPYVCQTSLDDFYVSSEKHGSYCSTLVLILSSLRFVLKRGL